MDKLKTLKDLEEVKIMGLHPADVNIFRYEFSKDLRQEAIKWIRNIQNRIFHLEARANKGLPINKLEIWENMGKSNVLMDFFNITEEQLNLEKLETKTFTTDAITKISEDGVA